MDRTLENAKAKQAIEQTITIAARAWEECGFGPEQMGPAWQACVMAANRAFHAGRDATAASLEIKFCPACDKEWRE